MAPPPACSSIVVALFCLINACLASRILNTAAPVVEDPQLLLRYHQGALLRGNISVNLIWYGRFTPPQRAIVADFVASLSPAASPHRQSEPTVAGWWKTVEKYYQHVGDRDIPTLRLGSQILDEGYSAGKSLSDKNIVQLASKGGKKNAINVVLTAKDVAVAGFCVNRCGTHGSRRSAAAVKGKKSSKFAYIWVGNSETRCPGYCAWPFHQPTYGPQSPPLVAPNNDVGIDGLVMSLSGLLAATATNPFGNGFYQGPPEAPLEAATACPGVYAKGAYPGYAGDLLVDPTTGASYNAHGANNDRKFLLPAIYDPSTSKCSTLV